MAIIDPTTRMNPAAQKFHELAAKEIERISDENFKLKIGSSGAPYLTHWDVSCEWPQGSDIHAKREGVLEILALTNSGPEYFKLLELYNAGYYAGMQDEASNW